MRRIGGGGVREGGGMRVRAKGGEEGKHGLGPATVRTNAWP